MPKIKIEIYAGNERIDFTPVEYNEDTSITIYSTVGSEETRIRVPAERVVQLANALKLLKRGK